MSLTLTATEALRNAGYGHRPGGNPYLPHIIYRLNTGEVVAQLRAHEVWAFLRELEPSGKVSP